jgi:hypothetical protein
MYFLGVLLGTWDAKLGGIFIDFFPRIYLGGSPLESGNFLNFPHLPEISEKTQIIRLFDPSSVQSSYKSYLISDYIPTHYSEKKLNPFSIHKKEERKSEI